MGVDEQARHRLYLRLEEVLGAEEASTMMEHLPPVGWGDVATKHDLAQLDRQLDLKLEALASRLTAELYRALAKQTRSFMVISSAMAFGVGGLVLAAARLV